MSTAEASGTRDEFPHTLLRQPAHARSLKSHERANLIISMRDVDGEWVVASRYADDLWWLSGGTTNSRKSTTKVDFATVPEPFREVLKATFYRLLRRGRDGRKRAGSSVMFKSLRDMRPFLEFLHSLGISRLSDVTQFATSAYVQVCKEHKTAKSRGKVTPKEAGRPLASGTVFLRLSAVEALYELSQYTDDPIPHHPWPETSADHLSGNGQRRRDGGSITPLIPDNIFVSLFQRAWELVQGSDRIYNLRDMITELDESDADVSSIARKTRRNKALGSAGWSGGYGKLKTSLTELRTACYIVLASLSGCRNHELCYLRSNAYFSTEDDDGEVYWWMRSKSTKTDEGQTEWMIPEAAVAALKSIDRWATPYQAVLLREIDDYRANDPADLRIAEAQDHVGAVFLGMDRKAGNQVRTVSSTEWSVKLRAFAVSCGLRWDLASHQFRRKFANYAARSQFGDLRYLREHFKHWSLDMTLGYAMNESQEMALYMDISDELDDIKQGVVSGWLDGSEPLAGGYGNNIVNWRSRSDNITLFKSQSHMVRSIAESTAIRSNGHAWCTADDNQCIGNDLERTRCGAGCGNAVVGRQHAPFYQGLLDQLLTFADREDIGEGGRKRVQRDLERCRLVLNSLDAGVAGATA